MDETLSLISAAVAVTVVNEFDGEAREEAIEMSKRHFPFYQGSKRKKPVVGWWGWGCLLVGSAAAGRGRLLVVLWKWKGAIA